MTNYYVDASSGADGNDGLVAATAKQTIAAAIAAASDGDTVRLRGVFDEAVITGKSLTFVGDVFAVIDRNSAPGSTAMYLTGVTVRVENIVVRNCALRGIVTETDDAVIENCEAINCGSAGSGGGIIARALSIGGGALLVRCVAALCDAPGFTTDGPGTFLLNHCTAYGNSVGYRLKTGSAATIKNSIGQSSTGVEIDAEAGLPSQYKLGSDFNNWYGIVSTFGASLVAHKAALPGRDLHSTNVDSMFVNSATSRLVLLLTPASPLVGASADGLSVGARERGFQILPSPAWTLDPELTYAAGPGEISLNTGETVGMARSPVVDLGAEYELDYADLLALETFYTAYLDTFLPGPYAPPDPCTFEIRGAATPFPAADPIFGYPDYVDVERRGDPALTARYVQVRLTFRRP